MKVATIYFCRNVQTWRIILNIYVGQTTRELGIRVAYHRYTKKSLLGKDIHKYGWENFRVYVIEECNSQEELWERERYWIKTLKSQVHFGYNISSGVSLNRKVRVKEKIDKRNYDEKNIEVFTISHVMNIISSKWKLTIILCLAENGGVRYNKLRRRVTGITHFMLAKSLKELEGDGLVNRKILKSDPPQIIEYSLTPLALELLPALNELYTWGNKHLNS